MVENPRISAVDLYARFNLGLRDVEELMAERGVEVSYETCPSYKLSNSAPDDR